MESLFINFFLFIFVIAKNEIVIIVNSLNARYIYGFILSRKYNEYAHEGF